MKSTVIVCDLTDDETGEEEAMFDVELADFLCILNDINFLSVNEKRSLLGLPRWQTRQPPGTDKKLH